jgi:hypothetical protein
MKDVRTVLLSAAVVEELCNMYILLGVYILEYYCVQFFRPCAC